MRSRSLFPALALTLLAVALCSGPTARAFSGNQVRAPASGPSQIAIRAIDLVAEVVPVEYKFTDQNLTWQTAANAVAWHRSSAMPGLPGNAVMSGHNATRGSGVFRNLHKVKIGDSITVLVNGRTQDYVVTDRVIFTHLFASQPRRAENAAWLGHFGDERLTLITCYPWYTNTHRLVVVAHPVDPPHGSDTMRYQCSDGSLRCPEDAW